MGWVPTEPPPGALSPRPPPPMRAQMGWGPPQRGASTDPQLWFGCYQPGYFATECTAGPRAHAHTAIYPPPDNMHGSSASAFSGGAGYAAPTYPHSMYYSGGFQAEAPYGSGGFTPADAPAPPYVSSSDTSHCGPEPTHSSSSASTFDPRFLIAQITHPRKNACSAVFEFDVIRANGVEDWLLDLGNTPRYW